MQLHNASPSPLSIRPAHLSDLAAVLSVAKTTFLETWEKLNTPEDMAMYLAEKFTENNMAAELSDPHNRFLLALAGERVVGYAKLRTSKIPDALKGRKCIEIERMYILKECKGMEIGSALMKQCLQYAAENQYETVWLGVWNENPAVRFYEKWGFEWFGFHTFILGNDHQRDELMKRDLAGT